MVKKSSKTNALRMLDKARVPYRLLPYDYDPENLDVKKIAEDNDLELAQVYKTLVCNGPKSEVVVAVIAGDSSLHLKSLAKASGLKKLTLMPIKALTATTGYVRGGCSPVGMKKAFPVIIDRAAEAWDEIFINAGRRGLLFGCDPKMLAAALHFKWAEISLPESGSESP